MRKQAIFQHRSFALVVILTLYLAGGRHVAAMAFQSVEDIANTARAFVYAQMSESGSSVEVSVDQIDRRLRLKQCSQQLEAFSPGYGSRQGMNTVGIRCNSEQPWSIYVPVTVKVFKNVAVLKRPVTRNLPLTEADITLENTDISRLNSGYYTEINEITGKMLTQNLAPGTILTQHLLKTPMAIKRGQLVTLIAKNPVIEVRAEGKALSRGAVGDRIRVKNLKTQRIIEGVILDNQLINVSL